MNLKFFLVLVMFLLIILYLGSFFFNAAPKEKLSSATLINAFCKEQGYDYGVSYFVKQDEYLNIILNSDRITYDQNVICVRNVREQKNFISKYNRWTQNKILVSEGEK